MSDPDVWGVWRGIAGEAFGGKARRRDEELVEPALGGRPGRQI